MNLELAKFDMKAISFRPDENKGPVIVLIGRRDTGKSFLVQDLMFHHQDIPIGTVISQTPSDVSTVGKGEKIELVISKGPSKIFIPNVYSLSKLAATKILEDLGFKVEFKYIAKKKSVTNVSPKTGTAVTPGSTVTITLG